MGIGTINDNGERLCHFCDESNMVIAGPLSQNKDIHNMTWTSPTGATKSQIDHMEKMEKLLTRCKVLQRSRCRKWSQPTGGSCLTEAA